MVYGLRWRMMIEDSFGLIQPKLSQFYALNRHM